METGLLMVMLFFLVAIMLTGGFVLMIPLSRQLAKFLDYRMQDKVGANSATANEVRQLRAIMEGLEEKVNGISERQQFIEKVLETRDHEQPQLPR